MVKGRSRCCRSMVEGSTEVEDSWWNDRAGSHVCCEVVFV